MTVRHYSESIIELSARISKRKPFKLKLPGDARLFQPIYDGGFFIEGDIIIFATRPCADEYLFIGRIKNIGLKPTGERWYDVDCILRPKARDPARKVNWLPKARIKKDKILCEIEAIK
jgi:hypothetical protein